MYLFVGWGLPHRFLVRMDFRWGKPHPTSELCGDPAIGVMNYQKR